VPIGWNHEILQKLEIKFRILGHEDFYWHPRIDRKPEKAVASDDRKEYFYLTRNTEEVKT
jgi:hypothetical protein